MWSLLPFFLSGNGLRMWEGGEKLHEKKGKRITIRFPQELSPYIIPKGSVAVDGVSLTIASVKNLLLEVEIIPITLEHTNFSDLKTGCEVNIECDIIGKYVYNYSVRHKKNAD